MRIDLIELNNIGPYEGVSRFETKTDSQKNIVLIGGKNGAGKTTLFNAIRICLYSYKSMGFKNFGVAYRKAVQKLINDHAKLSTPSTAYVELHLAFPGKQGPDQYILHREWKLADSLTEQFSVSCNGVPLSEEDIADFEKYLMSVIPAELFDLYFFDGETIADYFLNEGSNRRLKDAFLTLCGYDTFEIMEKNFKRIASANRASGAVLDEYLSAQKAYNSAKELKAKSEAEHAGIIAEIDSIDAELKLIEREYKESGGITQSEWNAKLAEISEEEKRRESINAYIRKASNDILPFIIIREQLVALRDQVSKENSGAAYQAFIKTLNVEKISRYLQRLDSKAVQTLDKMAVSIYGAPETSILDLSFEQSSKLFSRINSLLDYDPEKIIAAKAAIKASIKRTSSIRNYLETHSVDSAKKYGEERIRLLEQKSTALEQLVNAERKIGETTAELNNTFALYNKAKNALTDELKKSSMTDISTKAILMLDKLQTTLYRRQLRKVEESFMEILGILMRKEHLIDAVEVDDDFIIHLYKQETIPWDKLQQDIMDLDESALRLRYGEKAIQFLFNLSGADSYYKLQVFFASYFNDVVLPMEKSIDSLSKGEKQILIMALYYALISLCNHEVPFVIDTPFARIDSEHRENIARYFFSALNSQVFILSTNEEIDEEHLKAMSGKIGRTFLLENDDDLRTRVVKDSYFGG